MRLLFVTPRPPWPGFRGDQARPAGWIRHLRQRHEIRVVCQRWHGFPEPLPPQGVTVNTVEIGQAELMGSAFTGSFESTLRANRPLQTNLFRQRKFSKKVEGEVKSFRPDAVVVVLSRLADVLPVLDSVPVFLDFIDSLALNMSHRADQEKLAAKWMFRRESRLFRAWDASALARAQGASVVAERDRAAILDGISGDLDRRSAAEKLKVLPFGLDLPDRLQRTPISEPPRIVLTGNLGYFPTVDGVSWFFERVWPAVQKDFPQVVWELAGARPGPEIRRLAQHPGIRVTPDPADLETIRRGAAVAIAPLRSGSGTPIKILEAMAAGIPVVTTPAGADGLDQVPSSALSVAGEPEAFAGHVLRLLRDPGGSAETTREAWAWLSERHDLKRSALDLEKELLRIAG